MHAKSHLNLPHLEQGSLLMEKSAFSFHTSYWYEISQCRPFGSNGREIRAERRLGCGVYTLCREKCAHNSHQFGFLWFGLVNFTHIHQGYLYFIGNKAIRVAVKQRWLIYVNASYSISQEICTRFCCALLCCGYAIIHNEFTWSIYPYSSGLLCWHWGNR